MKIKNLDHIVLTVADIKKSVKFYTEVLGFKKEIFNETRVALKFGKQKINLHKKDEEFKPHAKNPTTGSADLCFIIEDDITLALRHVKSFNIKVIEGIVTRTGALGEIDSFYFRDPDKNLIEISKYKS